METVVPPTFVDTAFLSAEDLQDADNKYLSSWKLRTLKDARTPRPKKKYFVAKMHWEGSLSLYFGAPGSLKSMLLMDMIANVAGGWSWLNPMGGKQTDSPPLDTLKAGSLWIDYDNGEDRTAERLEAIANAYNLPADAPITYQSLELPWLDLSKMDNAIDLIRLIQRGNYGIVVIDNLGLIKGGANENSDDMQPVMSNLRLIAETTRCAIILIHHQRKASTNVAGDAIRKGELLRGYSGIEAACDLIIHVDRIQGEDIVVLTPTKVRGVPPFESKSAVFAYDNENDELKSARFYGYEVESKKDSQKQLIKETIVDALKETPGLNQKALVTRVRDIFGANGMALPGINRVRGIITDMDNSGALTKKEGEATENPEMFSYFVPRYEFGITRP
jgi:hypothetical protein